MTPKSMSVTEIFWSDVTEVLKTGSGKCYGNANQTHDLDLDIQMYPFVIGNNK